MISSALVGHLLRGYCDVSDTAGGDSALAGWPAGDEESAPGPMSCACPIASSGEAISSMVWLASTCCATAIPARSAAAISVELWRWVGRSSAAGGDGVALAIIH